MHKNKPMNESQILALWEQSNNQAIKFARLIEFYYSIGGDDEMVKNQTKIGKKPSKMRRDKDAG